MTATAASLGGWRAVSTVAALVLALLFGLMSQAAHASEIFEHGAHAEAALVKHDDQDGSPIHKIFHVGHCASHCPGHLVGVPPFATSGAAPIAISSDWNTPEPGHLSGLPLTVPDQPPRG